MPTTIPPAPKNDRPEKALYGFLYLALREDDKLKVGISMYPDRRRKQLETSTGMKIVGWEAFMVFAPAACERYVHGKLDKLRLRGEWFCTRGIRTVAFQSPVPVHARTAGSP